MNKLAQNGVAVSFLVTIASGTFALSALASAVGVQPFKEGTIDTPFGSYDIPRGELDHGITGEGLYVESEAAGFTSVAPVCNWRVDYALTDVSGNEYERYEGPLVSDCDTNTKAPGVRWERNVRPGQACAILYTNSVEIARQCHNITEN